jgi:hypothetical protein
LTKLYFIRKLRPKRIHRIGSSYGRKIWQKKFEKIVLLFSYPYGLQDFVPRVEDSRLFDILFDKLVDHCVELRRLDFVGGTRQQSPRFARKLVGQKGRRGRSWNQFNKSISAVTYK